MSCISEENYQMAVTVVRKHGTGSVSNLQRKMHWGYNQAATAIERMESEFIVGPMSTSGRREVFPEQIHKLWKEKESLKAHDIEITPEITEALDSEISQIENSFIEKHLLDNNEAEKLEILITKAMKLGELYAKRDAKAQSVPEGFVLVQEDQAKDTARLDFMLSGHNKVVVEDNDVNDDFDVVATGYAVNEVYYISGWDKLTKVAKSKREAIDKAMIEAQEQNQEDAELNAIADSRKDQKRISVNLDDL